MKQSITIRTMEGDKVVDADVRGHIAVHRDVGPWNCWNVTHIPTGRFICMGMRTKEIAMECSRALRSLRVDWSFSDPEGGKSLPKKTRARIIAIKNRFDGAP